MSRKRNKGPRVVPVEGISGLGLGPRGRELVALCLMGLCLFGLLSLATFDPSSLDAEGIPRGGLRNLGGVVGYALASGFTFVFGASAWLLFLAGGVAGVLFFQGRTVDKPILKVLGIVVFAAMASLLLAGPYGDAESSRWFPYGPGGRFGANLSPKLYAAFGGSGRLLILMFGMLCSLLLATEWLVSQLLVASLDLVERVARRVRLPRPAFAGLGGSMGGGAVAESEDPPARARPASAAVDAEEAGDTEDEEVSPATNRRRRRRQRAEIEAVEEVVATDAVDAEAAADEGVDGIDPDLDDEASAFDETEATDGDACEVEEEGDVAEPEDPVAASDEDSESAADDGSEDPNPTRASRASAARKRRRRARAKHPELPLLGPYPYPPLSLFRDVPPVDLGNVQPMPDDNAKAIEKRLLSFKIEAQVVERWVGPTVTMYEVNVGEGIRVGKVSGFEPDLAAALRAVSIRIVAPIPGKDTVGIEVPNKRRNMVLMRELVEQFGVVPDMAIPLFLGKDATGKPIVEDLARMPHLLIAGTTGSGKSVCINVILLSILMTRTPQQVRMILIDPKMVELQSYKDVPHLACDLVTNMKKAPAVLEWAVDEMERRYEMLKDVGTTNISNFNAMGQEEIENRLQRPIEPSEAQLSYIVVVIDEFADLMATAQKDVEDSIQRLAQKSRAVGIHVILATQRPSANVITGVIKANLPAQIAFKVSRKLDSRVILDMNGAEKLFGHGDMLFVSPAVNQTIRAQGALVTEEEVKAVVAHIVDNGPQRCAIPALIQTETAQKRGFADQDELYVKAVEVILSQQRGSATLIQRALSVGYTRATRLLEMMEEDGLVGAYCGSKSRDVLMTLEEWQEREAAMDAELAELEEDGEFEDDELLEEDDVTVEPSGAAREGGAEASAEIGLPVRGGDAPDADGGAEEPSASADADEDDDPAAELDEDEVLEREDEDDEEEDLEQEDEDEDADDIELSVEDDDESAVEEGVDATWGGLEDGEEDSDDADESEGASWGEDDDADEDEDDEDTEDEDEARR
ncbi:MAG: hypothetical protein RL562_736 [Planctomycetota bacterium]